MVAKEPAADAADAAGFATAAPPPIDDDPNAGATAEDAEPRAEDPPPPPPRFPKRLARPPPLAPPSDGRAEDNELAACAAGSPLETCSGRTGSGDGCGSAPIVASKAPSLILVPASGVGEGVGTGPISAERPPILRVVVSEPWTTSPTLGFAGARY